MSWWGCKIIYLIIEECLKIVIKVIVIAQIFPICQTLITSSKSLLLYWPTWSGGGGKILDLAPTGCLPKVWVQCQKADPILIEQKNLINMAECVATVQDNGTIIRNRSRNASLSVCHSRVLPSVIDLAIATALPIVCREEKNSGQVFFAGLQKRSRMLQL